MNTRTDGQGPISSAMDIAARIAANRIEGEDVENPDEEVQDEDEEELETGEGPEVEPDEDDDPDHVTDDQDDEEGEPDDVPATAAPASWPKDQLEEWEALSPDAQEVVLKREKEVQTAISEKGREAAEARRLADEAKSRAETEITTRIEKLDGLYAKLSKGISDDESQLTEEFAREEPEKYLELSAKVAKDKKAAEEAKKEILEARHKEIAEFQAAQHKRLFERNPQYAGEEGAKLLAAEVREVEAFAKALPGVNDEDLQMLSADLYEVLRDAMEFRKATEKADPPKKKAKKPAQKAVRPGARKATDAVKKKTVAEARKRVKTATGRNAQDREVANLLAAKRKG